MYTLIIILLSLFSFGGFGNAEARLRCDTGRVTAIQGHADHESAVQSRVEALKVGSCIEDGMSVLTRAKSVARFRLSSPANVSVAPSSELLVGFPTGGKPTKLVLTRGEIKIDSESSSDSSSPLLNVLRMGVAIKEKGTVFLSEVFRDGQEGWIVVLHGTINLHVGSDPQVITMKAGQSAYFTDEQTKLPSVVSLDSHELFALEQDRIFKQTVSQIVMVEIASLKAADTEPEDLTLDQYVAREKAQEDARKAPKLPSPPHSVNLPRVQIIEKPQRPEIQSPSAAVSVAQSSENLSTDSLRIEAGAAFFSDAAGPDFSVSYLKQYDTWSIGGGGGYSHASKADVDVNGVKIFALSQYRFHLGSNLNLEPEMQAGFGFEQLTSQSVTYANGLAFYYSPRVTLSTDLGHEGEFHPGLTAGFQGYAGGASTLSAIVELSLRFRISR